MKRLTSLPRLRATAVVLLLLVSAQARPQPTPPPHVTPQPVTDQPLPTLSPAEIETRMRALIASMADLASYVPKAQSDGTVQVRHWSDTSRCSKPPKITDPGTPVPQAQLESAARVLLAVNAATQSGKALKFNPVTWSCNPHKPPITP